MPGFESAYAAVAASADVAAAASLSLAVAQALALAVHVEAAVAAAEHTAAVDGDVGAVHGAAAVGAEHAAFATAAAHVEGGAGLVAAVVRVEAADVGAVATEPVPDDGAAGSGSAVGAAAAVAAEHDVLGEVGFGESDGMYVVDDLGELDDLDDPGGIHVAAAADGTEEGLAGRAGPSQS